MPRLNINVSIWSFETILHNGIIEEWIWKSWHFWTFPTSTQTRSPAWKPCGFSARSISFALAVVATHICIGIVMFFVCSIFRKTSSCETWLIAVNKESFSYFHVWKSIDGELENLFFTVSKNSARLLPHHLLLEIGITASHCISNISSNFASVIGPCNKWKPFWKQKKSESSCLISTKMATFANKKNKEDFRLFKRRDFSHPHIRP